MALVAVVVILIAWALYAIGKATEPSAPPIDNMAEHLNYIQSLPNQKARQRYIKDRQRGKRK